MLTGKQFSIRVINYARMPQFRRDNFSFPAVQRTNNILDIFNGGKGSIIGGNVHHSYFSYKYGKFLTSRPVSTLHALQVIESE